MSILRARPVADPGAQLNFEAIEDALHVGNGSPEGVVAANPGAIYEDRTNGTVYSKATGTGKTGWVAIGGGGGTNIAIRGYDGAVKTYPTAVTSVLRLPNERYNSVGAALHDTSKTAVALTGTVAKTAGSATLTGTGTAFTTELKLGEWITVPGGASETKVITAIASNTSLTVASNFANTASGQSATVDQTGRLYAPVGGVYRVAVAVAWVGISGGNRIAQLRLNGVTLAGDDVQTAFSTGGGTCTAFPEIKLAAGEFVVVWLYQNSGGDLNMNSGQTVGAMHSPEVSMSYVAAG